MTKKTKQVATELSEHDRRILDKYTKFYSNFIESNTAKNYALEDENFDRRE